MNEPAGLNLNIYIYILNIIIFEVFFSFSGEWEDLRSTKNFLVGGFTFKYMHYRNTFGMYV